MRTISEIARTLREQRRIGRTKLPWRELETEAERQGCSAADIFFDRAGRSVPGLPLREAAPARRDLQLGVQARQAPPAAPRQPTSDTRSE